MSRIDLEIPELSYAAEEALNRLRVNVKFTGANTRRLLITSSIPGEGKSHISLYLWKMLAEAGFRTVLVDADLRRSSLKKEMKFSFTGECDGLAAYLSGLADYEQVVHETNVENGALVPCVNLLQNPSPLLEDPRLKELMELLARDFDYVIVDSPPLVSVSDGAQLAAVCDGAILVVRSGETPRMLVRQSLSQLERTHCRLLGTVLNGVRRGGRGYGYNYYQNYARSYYYRNYRYYDYYSDYYGETDEESEQKQ